MKITVNKFNKEIDSEEFNKLSFDTLVSMKGIPPGMSRSDFFNQLIPMIDEYAQVDVGASSFQVYMHWTNGSKHLIGDISV